MKTIVKLKRQKVRRVKTLDSIQLELSKHADLESNFFFKDACRGVKSFKKSKGGERKNEEERDRSVEWEK